MKCENCMHWEFYEDDEDGERVGECRRYPPISTDDSWDENSKFHWGWPIVQKDQRCGEFKLKRKS